MMARVHSSRDMIVRNWGTARTRAVVFRQPNFQFARNITQTPIASAYLYAASIGSSRQIVQCMQTATDAWFGLQSYRSEPGIFQQCSGVKPGKARANNRRISLRMAPSGRGAARAISAAALPPRHTRRVVMRAYSPVGAAVSPSLSKPISIFSLKTVQVVLLWRGSSPGGRAGYLG